jgi:hypothetical protein
MATVPSAKIVLASVVAILSLHATAVVQEWYITLTWIDIVLHVLGGAWVALVFFYVQTRVAQGIERIMPWWFFLALALGFVMLVGVAWEWFEYGFDFFFAKENFAWRAQLGLTDTMGDLFADLVGGVIIAILVMIWQNLHSMAGRRK